jgi:Domain of unknown function (DUF4253)
LQPARIGLAAASRPADLLPLIGWDGAASRWEDAVVIAAVLRSWEEQFGARLLRVGFAGIQLLADRPPRTLQAALRLPTWTFGGTRRAPDSPAPRQRHLPRPLAALMAGCTANRTLAALICISGGRLTGDSGEPIRRPERPRAL